MRWMGAACLASLLAGCNIELDTTERNCAERTAWWPDEDGDGVGEPTSVYVGCEPPEGYVAVVDTAGGDSGYAGTRRRSATTGWRLPRATPRSDLR